MLSDSRNAKETEPIPIAFFFLFVLSQVVKARIPQTTRRLLRKNCALKCFRNNVSPFACAINYVSQNVQKQFSCSDGKKMFP